MPRVWVRIPLSQPSSGGRVAAFVITYNDGDRAFLTSVDDCEEIVTIQRPADDTKEIFLRDLKVGLTVEGTPSIISEPAPAIN